MKLFEVIFDVEGKEKKLDEIGKLMSDPDFWDSNGENQKILKERTLLLNSIAPWKQEVKELEEMNILLQLIEEQKDEQEAQDLLQKIEKSEETIKQMEFQRMLGGEQDPETPSSASMQEQAGQRLRIGLRCSSGCTCDGRKDEGFKRRLSTFSQARKPASRM